MHVCCGKGISKFSIEKISAAITSVAMYAKCPQNLRVVNRKVEAFYRFGYRTPRVLRQIFSP